MSSVLFSEIADLQISKFANIGAFAILIFDFCITFQDEVKWTWTRPWDIIRVIFTISRYLPFIGSGLTAYAALRVSGPPAPSLAENIIHIIGIVAAEGLLVVRTWAFWRKSRRVLIGLVTVIAAVSINVLPNHHLISAGVSTIPGQDFYSSRNAALVYAILALFQCVILALTAYKKFGDYRKIESSIINTIYGGSIFYMLCIIAITVANVIIDAVFPIGYTNMLDTLQVVIHSVLASRIMFHLRSSHHACEMHASSMLMMSEAIQYGQLSQTQTNDLERRSNV
ncbi:uncharacterized protein F5891DRAFT_711995 [Suillus fuscotomentosus]|uniref:DUF6533 domain-containing protein n=1 Tax=Suillus fuscotomentosus TaxID=1912939 RepID=A0AAD4HFW9_9AGAM|nr:uncharacterized protein F5891DRAFT_711995 [Suillus fuscotomentosus]KAG1894701.1 hypothetical protein F5891DRAFT_711995 [Suillus fuscotomentosus]